MRSEIEYVITIIFYTVWLIKDKFFKWVFSFEIIILIIIILRTMVLVGAAARIIFIFFIFFVKFHWKINMTFRFEVLHFALSTNKLSQFQLHSWKRTSPSSLANKCWSFEFSVLFCSVLLLQTFLISLLLRLFNFPHLLVSCDGLFVGRVLKQQTTASAVLSVARCVSSAWFFIVLVCSKLCMYSCKCAGGSI